MGKKDKHKLGQSRNNPIFKVANGKLKQKNKPKEVTTKLKKVRIYNIKAVFELLGFFLIVYKLFLQISKQKTIKEVDDQLKSLQNNSISVNGKAKNKADSKIDPSGVLAKKKANVDDLVEVMDTANMNSKK